jgi:hypothetical protein
LGGDYGVEVGVAVGVGDTLGMTNPRAAFRYARTYLTSREENLEAEVAFVISARMVLAALSPSRRRNVDFRADAVS